MAQYDNLINWQEFYSSYLRNVTVSGKELKALCPLHEDRNPSFSANIETGLWKCYGCDKSGNPQTFLQELHGISAQDALEQLNRMAGVEPQEQQKKRKKYTIEDYAQAKKLPVEFLKQLGIKQGKNWIIIPYMDESGAVVSSRQRHGGEGGPRFTWTRGSKVGLYGLWELAKIREQGYVILVEGESDSHTLWYQGYPALGAPGASTFQPAWAELLKGLKIYVFKEPDISGETFLRKVSQSLVKVKFEGEVRQISLMDSKDPSELHCKDPSKFKEHWQAAMDMAEKINIAQVSGQVENVIPDAPVQLRQVPEWRFNEDGIFAVNEKTGLPYCVCRTPILLKRRLRSLETGQEKMEICYRRDGEWHKAVVNRSTLFQSRTITQLSDLGITVTSENAKHLVKFLGALEAENIDLLERADCVSQLGWHGRQFVPGLNGDLVIDVDPSMAKWLNAYHQEGSLQGWLDMVEPCRKNNIFRFMLAASFAAPLLRLVRHPIFIVHNWGDSRSGKTAALKAALSAWGEPDGLMASFYATRVGLERLAGFFRDLPLGVDEKQVSSSADFVDNLLYMMTLGSGKVRGSKSGGLQVNQAWRTIIMTTGEEPLTRMTSHSGVHTRALEIYGSPFEHESQAQPFHEMTHYGFAGPEFIRIIAQVSKENLRSMHKYVTNILQANFQDRISSHISAAALVAVADSCISECIVGMDAPDAMERAIAMASEILGKLGSFQESDLVERAYEFVQGWVLSNYDQFTSAAHPPRYGFIDEMDRFYVFPQILQQALERAGFPYRRVIQGFRERNMIFTNNDKKNTVVKRFEGRIARFYQLNLSDDIRSNTLSEEEEFLPT